MDSAMTTVISMKDIVYTHPKGGGALPAFEGMAFTVSRGELVCLAGENGSGKSTLLCLLAGLYACTTGQYELFGVDVLADEVHAPAALNRVSFLMQDAEVQLFGATVEEDVLLGLPDTEQVRQEADDVLRRLGLFDCKDLPPHALSYGQKRKLCLASALLRHPDVLLLDEPFSGLDYPGIKELRNILKECKDSGVTVLVSTHDLDPIYSFMDKVLVLNKERGSRFGTPEEILPDAEQWGVRSPLGRRGNAPW